MPGTWVHARGFKSSCSVRSISHLLIVFLIASFSLIFTSFAAAQQSVTSASLSGQVTDAGGGAIGRANLKATNPQTNQQLTAVTDAEGRFRFGYLPVGGYRIEVEAPGFSPVVKELTVTVGQALDLAAIQSCVPNFAQ